MERPESPPSETNGLSRRDFLGGAVALGVGLATSNVEAAWRLRRRRLLNFPLQHEQTVCEKFDANEWVKSFPEKEIPGIGNIRKVTNECARRVLVAIRQIHYSWLDGDNQNWPLLEQCQDEAKRAIESLRSNARMKLQGLYSEGMYDGETDSNFLARSAIPALKDKQDKRYVARWGADRALHQTLKLPLFGSESEALSVKATQVMEAERSARNMLAVEQMKANRSISPIHWHVMKKELDNLRSEVSYLSEKVTKHVFEPRENYFIEKVLAKSRNRVNYILFGGAHWWDNNLEDYNKKNPNDVVSLVELTPDSYLKWETTLPIPPQPKHGEEDEDGAYAWQPVPRLVA